MRVCSLVQPVGEHCHVISSSAAKVKRVKRTQQNCGRKQLPTDTCCCSERQQLVLRQYTHHAVASTSGFHLLVRC